LQVIEEHQGSLLWLAGFFATTMMHVQALTFYGSFIVLFHELTRPRNARAARVYVVIFAAAAIMAEYRLVSVAASGPPPQRFGGAADDAGPGATDAALPAWRQGAGLLWHIALRPLADCAVWLLGAAGSLVARLLSLVTVGRSDDVLDSLRAFMTPRDAGLLSVYSERWTVRWGWVLFSFMAVFVGCPFPCPSPCRLSPA
jgi:hypothetical protein